MLYVHCLKIRQVVSFTENDLKCSPYMLNSLRLSRWHCYGPFLQVDLHRQVHCFFSLHTLLYSYS